MLRFVSAFVAVSVVLTLVAVAGVATAEEEKERAPAIPMVAIDTEHYRVTYPLAFSLRVPPLKLIGIIEDARERVEAEFGPFKTKIEMFVPGRIVSGDPEFPEGLSLAGLCYKGDDGVIHVIVALHSCEVGTFAHELLHARMREMGLEPPVWFEEGAAHYIESEDGFNAELFDLLERDGALSKKEIAEIKGITDKEMQLRASGWAVIYYLAKHKGLKLAEIVRLAPDDLPEPMEALKWIAEEQEKAYEDALEELLEAFSM